MSIQTLDYSIGDLTGTGSSGSSGSGGINIGTGGSVGAAAGTIIPGIGTAIGATVGSIIGLLGQIGIIRGKTQHMNYDTANAKAKDISSKLNTIVRNSYDKSTYDKISEAYRLRMIQLIPTRWGDPDSPVQQNDIITALQNYPMKADYAGVYTVTWLWAMWSLQNFDLNNPQEWAGYAQNDLNGTLVGAIKNVTGATLPALDLGVTGTGLDTKVTKTTGGFLGTTFAGIGSNAPLILILIGLAVAFIFMKGR